MNTTDLVPLSTAVEQPTTCPPDCGNHPAPPDRTGRVVAVGALVGGSVATVTASGSAGWSWAVVAAGLIAAVVVLRRAS